MRKLRPPAPGIYHVATRTSDKRDLFTNDHLRVFLLALFARVVTRLEWICWSYVLMGTHYHLIVDTPNANLSRGMQFVNGVYGQRANKLAGRYGHVFSARFCSREITDDDDLLGAIRYVARNPVEAGLCRDPGDWLWGSYAAIMGTATPSSFLDVRRTLRLFGSDDTVARDGLRRLVAGDDAVNRKAAAYVPPLDDDL